MLVLIGLGNVAGKNLDWMEATSSFDSENKRKDAFVDKFHSVVNNEILGTSDNPGQFRLNFETDRTTGTKILLPISLTNFAVRKIVDNLDKIIDISVGCGDEHRKWKESTAHYKSAISIYERKGRLYT